MGFSRKVIELKLASYRSDSIYRSAAALCALVQVSSASGSIGSLYFSVARIEPIFKVETLANSLSDSHPEKEWFLLLAKVARANLYLWKTFKSDSQFSLKLRQSLTSIFGSTRCVNIYSTQIFTHVKGVRSIYDIVRVGEACLLLAQVTSWLWSGPMSRPAYFDIAETSWLLVIFLIKSSVELDRHATITGRTQHVAHAALSTLFRWLDTTIYFVLCRTHTPETSVIKHIEYVLSMYALFLRYYLILINGSRSTDICCCTKCSADSYTRMIFHQSVSRVDKVSVISRDVLPRRIRTNAVDLIQVFRHNTDASRRRALRFLSSSEELEREIQDSARKETSKSPLCLIATDDEALSIEKLQNTLQQAQKVHASGGPLTEEFVSARFAGMERMQVWKEYKEHCQMRHTWGEYFRSNLDWDWDPSHSLKDLYGIEGEKKDSEGLWRF